MEVLMNELIESIQSIRNRCDVIQLLYDTPGYLHLIPTVLEDLLADCTGLIEYCKADEKDHA
jgi:hypothetical protein